MWLHVQAATQFEQNAEFFTLAAPSSRHICIYSANGLWFGSNHGAFRFGSNGCALNSLASGCFWGFSKKKHINARGFVWEYLHSCTGYRPGRSVKRHGKSSSLHSKKIFAWGMQVFCE